MQNNDLFLFIKLINAIEKNIDFTEILKELNYEIQGCKAKIRIDEIGAILDKLNVNTDRDSKINVLIGHFDAEEIALNEFLENNSLKKELSFKELIDIALSANKDVIIGNNNNIYIIRA